MAESYKQFIKRKEKEFKEKKEKGELIEMKDINRKGKFCYAREAWTFMPQYNLPEKVFIIERLKLEEMKDPITNKSFNKLGDIEYRICYYIVGKNGKASNKWVWGQFCPMVPQKDYDKLFKKAKREGTIK